MDAEKLTAGRPIAGNLQLGLADAQPRALVKLHHGHAFDGDVLAEHARLDWHPCTGQLGYRLGVKDADLAQGPTSMSITFEAEIGDQPTFSLRQFAELPGGVAVDRDKSRRHRVQRIVPM